MRNLARLDERCDRARNWASLGLDGELSELERALLDGHLASCAACRGSTAGVRSFTTALRAAALEPLDHPIELPVRRRLAAFTSVRVGAAAALVAGAVGLGAAVGLVSSHEAPLRLAAAGSAGSIGAVHLSRDLRESREFGNMPPVLLIVRRGLALSPDRATSP